MSDVRSFGSFLQSLEDGQLVDDLSEKLRELNGKLVRQAEAQGKAKGEIVLKIKLAADQGGTVQIDGELTIKEPKPARQRTVMWLTSEGALANENPRQAKLPLREVSTPREQRSV